MKILVLSLLGLFLVFCGLAQAIDESLVLYFSFDEGQGNNAKDGSLAKNHGKYIGKPKWVNGKPGKAVSYDGAGAFEIQHHNSLNALKGKGHTISYWLNWDGQGAGWSPFISKTIGENDNFHTWVGKDGIWDYENKPSGQTHAVTKIPLDGNWIHLTVTHDGKKTVSFYINGKLDKATNPLPTAIGNDINVLVGDDGKGNKGAGILDELSIFNRALTAEEAKTIYEDGMESFLAVASTDKLTTTWGNIKRGATRGISVN